MAIDPSARPRAQRSRGVAFLAAAALLLGGCASAPETGPTAGGAAFELYPASMIADSQSAPATQIASRPYASDADPETPPRQLALRSDELGQTGDGDPLEDLNRYFLDLNNALDALIFRQFAEAYRVVVPQGVRNSVTNFVRFIKTPVILANDLLQGDLERAQNTTSRFVVNAAIGFGFFDVAADSGLPYQEQDFGQTLAVYGVDSGPYIVLPLLGPSTARDGVGIGVDILLDPLTYVLTTEEGLARLGGEAVEARERNLDTLDEIRRDALDEYARIRSLWLQNRRDTIEKDRVDRDEDGRRDEILSSEATATADSLSFLHSGILDGKPAAATAE